MSFGPFIRKLLPPALERRASGAYRAVFVDLRKVAGLLALHVPEKSRVLDVGGGDGELLNLFLELRPDVSVTMVDVAASVGKFLEGKHRERVSLISSTSVEEHIEHAGTKYDAALISDVMHHLPIEYRGPFLQSVRSSLERGGGIFIKDIEPGHFISSLSLFCDKYVSGDRGVTLLSQKELLDLAVSPIDKHHSYELGLYEIDRPNYLMRIF